MRRSFFASAASMILTISSLASPAAAQPLGEGCQVGRSFGSTLLFPYFETDLSDFDGPATLISFNNRSLFPTMVRVVLWTDWGNPTLAFDVYMRRLSVQTLNLRDTLNGGVPSTGEGEDLSAFSGCNVNPPFHRNPALTADEIVQLKADHTGQLGPLAEDCAGSPHADGVARGYITVDVVDECNGIEGFDPKITPANTTRPYFSNGDGTGVAIDDNVLWGDIFYLSSANASAHGSAAVALWADETAFSSDGIFTFYGRYSNWDGRDNRVPLPNLWNQRFINGGPFAGGADVIVYQDTGRRPAYASCGNSPAHFPLQGTVFAINDPGDDIIDLSTAFGDIAGLATQRGSVGSLPVPFVFGWTELGSEGSQVWVQPTLSAAGIYSASLDGMPVEFLCDDEPIVETELRMVGWANRSNEQENAHHAPERRRFRPHEGRPGIIGADGNGAVGIIGRCSGMQEAGSEDRSVRRVGCSSPAS
ncbi:MAG: hypothetical protein MPN21_23230 [Thermoanaerobaculia bacterium]|nr:hypothetical protein [Thermoanaerobaculia bacterium]